MTTVRTRKRRTRGTVATLADQQRVQLRAALEPRETAINGKPASWPRAVRREFYALVGPLMAVGEQVTYANYFKAAPRSAGCGEWERGFVYTLNGRHVCYVKSRGES